MRPLLYILRKTLKNYIRELKKKPLALIFYILIALSFIAIIVMSFFTPSNVFKRGSIEGFGAIISGVLLVVLYFGLKQGITSGGSFFRLSDVNFTFTAPVSPKKVLIYGFIKQLSATLFTVLFLSFQVPNIRNNFPIVPYGMIIILGGMFFLISSMPLIGMLVYSRTSLSERIRNNFEKGLNITVFLVLGGFVLTLIGVKDFFKAAVLFLNSEYFYYIPFIGWFKGVFMTAVTGINNSFYINALLVAASFMLMAYGLYKLKTDYYEDVLAATERKEEVLKAKKEGRGALGLKNVKIKKARQKYKGGGARSIFYRHMLEYKKMGYLFVDKNTMIMALVGVSAKFFLPMGSINSVLFFSVYLLFFFSIQGKWVQELDKPFIYLIPDTSARKVFYATLPQSIKNLVDGLVLFVVVGFMFKADVVTMVLCALTYTTFGSVYTFGEMLSRRLFGAVHSKNLKFFTKMFLIIFLIMPGIIVFAALSIMFKNAAFISYFSYIALIAYNLLASAIVLLLSRGIFEKIEMV